MKLKFLRKIPHPQGAPYHYIVGRTFTNGAQAIAFDSFPLPLQSIIGPATVAGSLRVTQLPQVYQMQAVPIVGLGGLQAGQLVTAPLVNPNFSPIEPDELSGGRE
jgi:hypothetical protein